MWGRQSVDLKADHLEDVFVCSTQNWLLGISELWQMDFKMHPLMPSTHENQNFNLNDQST